MIEATRINDYAIEIPIEDLPCWMARSFGYATPHRNMSRPWQKARLIALVYSLIDRDGSYSGTVR